MNTHIQNLAMISAVLTFAGCQTNKPGINSEQGYSTEASIPGKSGKKQEIRSVKGIVKKIFYGKDGYVASIQASDNQLYFATISRVNLKDPKQFRNFNVNDPIQVEGDYWEIDDENQITVREIL